MLLLASLILIECALMYNATILRELEQAQALGCHLRMYTYRVEQADQAGRICWDNVSAMSCWGRCDSREIPDWRFPYKCTRHPVCIHATRSKAITLLRNCDAGAGPKAQRYEYFNADSCVCHTCKSTDEISCEGPSSASSHPHSHLVLADTKQAAGLLTMLSGDGNDYKDDDYAD